MPVSALLDSSLYFSSSQESSYSFFLNFPCFCCFLHGHEWHIYSLSEYSFSKKDKFYTFPSFSSFYFLLPVLQRSY